MLRLLIALLTLSLNGCAAPEESAEDAVANEAQIELTDAELAELRQRGDHGDREAIDALVNYFWINRGDTDEDTIYWQLQAARAGDCEHWADLMFMAIDEAHPVPPHFFSDGETLRSIGEAHNCPPHSPREPA